MHKTQSVFGRVLILGLIFGLSQLSCSQASKTSNSTRPSSSNLKTLGDVILLNADDSSKRSTDDLFADFKMCLQVCPDADRPHVRTLQVFFQHMNDLVEKHRFGEPGGMNLRNMTPAAKESLAGLLGVSDSLYTTSQYLIENYFKNKKYQEAVASFVFIISPAHRFYSRLQAGESGMPEGLSMIGHLERASAQLIKNGEASATAWFVLARSSQANNQSDLERVQNWYNCLKQNPKHTECQRGYKKAVEYYQRPICDIKSAKLENLKLACEAKTVGGKANKTYKYQGTEMILDEKVPVQRTALKGLELGTQSNGEHIVLLTFNDTGLDSYRKLSQACMNYRLGLVVNGKLISTPTVSKDTDAYLGATGYMAFPISVSKKEEAISMPQLHGLLCDEKKRSLPDDLIFSVVAGK